MRLDQHRVHRVLGVVHRTMERVEEPGEPRGHIERSELRALQDVVVTAAFRLDLSRQAVETLRTAIGAGEQQVAYRPGDTAVAVVERMQRNEPQMRQPRLENGRRVGVVIGPLEKPCCLAVETPSGGGSEMTPRTPDGPRHNLHGAMRVVAPCAGLYPRHTAEAGRKQSRVPSEQALPGQRGIAMRGSVEHHFNHTLYMPVDRR